MSEPRNDELERLRARLRELEEHGGRVEVTSALGEGTKVSLLIPLEAAEADRSTITERST